MTVTLLLYCDYQDLNCSLDLISPVDLMLVQDSRNDIHPTTCHLTPHPPLRYSAGMSHNANMQR